MNNERGIVLIRTLIVDDEYLIRHAIRSLIDWNSLGFQIVAEASDGLEALDLVDKYRPELIILDINIPLLDGIKVADKVREKYPHVKIIVLTGYDTFGYIQRCMRAGVMDYVVKPIEKDEFQKAVVASKREILKERNMEKFLEYFKHSDDLKVNSFFNEPQKNQADFMELFSEDIKKKECINNSVILLEADFLRQKFRTQKERIFSLMAVSIMVKEYLDKAGLSITMHPYKFNVLVGVGLTNSISPDLKTCFERAARQALENMNISISCGISNPFSEITDMNNAIVQAQKALEQKFCKGVGKIYAYDATQILYPDKSDFRVDTSYITSLLRQGEFNRVKDQLHEIISDAMKKSFCKEYFCFIAADLVNCIIHFSIELGLNTSYIFDNQRVYMSHIEKFETAVELENWLISLYKNVVSFSSNYCHKRSDRIISKCCEYIEKNYHSHNLSVTSIANNLFITSNYLCKIFKQEMKTTLTEYIVSFRMKKAKQFIEENKEHQIISLSKAVGYNDPFYFSKSFKKFYGISPSKYVNTQRSSCTEPTTPITKGS